MKVGDLVKVPTYGIEGTPSYIGLITDVDGYKITVHAGEHLGIRSWLGEPGVDTHNRYDLELIRSEE